MMLKSFDSVQSLSTKLSHLFKFISFLLTNQKIKNKMKTILFLFLFVFVYFA